MKEHHNQEGTDVPELGRTVVSIFKQVIHLHTFVAAFSGGSGIVGCFPFRAIAGWAVVETNVGV